MQIRSSQAPALTLTDIGSIIIVRQAGDVPCEHFSTLLAARLEDVHRRQEEVVLFENELHHLLSASKDLDPADCEAGSATSSRGVGPGIRAGMAWIERDALRPRRLVRRNART